jgi:hypothetical protein
MVVSVFVDGTGEDITCRYRTISEKGGRRWQKFHKDLNARWHCLHRLYASSASLYDSPYPFRARMVLGLWENIMLGLTFWKYASEEKSDKSDGGLAAALAPLVAKHQRQQKLRVLVLTGAGLAAVAIALGLPVIGLSVYLVATLPFILFAS